MSASHDVNIPTDHGRKLKIHRWSDEFEYNAIKEVAQEAELEHLELKPFSSHRRLFVERRNKSNYISDNFQGLPTYMLQKFIVDKTFPTVNFDITNDYFSDLTSECLKYHMFSRDLGCLETFVKTLGNDDPIDEKIASIPDWSVEFMYRNDKSLMLFVKASEHCFMEIVNAKNKVSFNIAAKNVDDINDISKLADEMFPTVKVSKAADSIPVAFWSLGGAGPVSRNKKIQPLYWNEIGNNYIDVTVGGVDALIKIRPPVAGGRLILWHGPPGTGKSSAIRSLMHTWLPWCNASYVVDPEAFFGSANYMLSVLLDKKDESNYDYDDDDDDEEEEDDNSKLVLQGTNRWNLLVIEDADEFLQADAKQRTGQALSRLLNLADGLIGQGLNFLVLITTNELLKNIHEAVQREGRCLSVNEFHMFDRDTAKKWLGDSAELLQSKKYVNDREFSLAKLYDMLRETQQIKENKPDLSIGVYL